MKIFSNFDTKLSQRLYHEAVNKYWRNHVLYIHRGAVYLLIKLFLPVLTWMFLSSLFFRLYYGVLWTKSVISDEVWFVVWWIVISMTFYITYFTWKNFVNYYMDFVIVTPDQLTAFDQEWIIKRMTRSLELRKIKTINVVSHGRLSSLFNFWSIIFLAEWDISNGDVTLSYISNPVKLRERIIELVELNNKSNADDD
jgi:hypothetical protein